MSDTYEIVMPVGDNPTQKIGVVKERRHGWKFNPTAIMWGRSRKGWPTPEAAAARVLLHYADRGAFMRVQAPKSE